MTEPRPINGLEAKKKQMTVSLRIRFEDAIKLVPTGMMKGTEANRWTLFLSDTMTEKVVSIVDEQQQEIERKDEALRLCVQFLTKYRQWNESPLKEASEALSPQS